MPPEVLEPVRITEPIVTHLEDAARLLEQALNTGGNDPNVAYMLALAYKRMGKTGDARNALRKIAQPDANTLLQMGLLSLQDKQPAQAEQEFARALEMDPASYEVCYNLALTRLALGKLEACAALIPRAVELAPGPDEQRFLRVLSDLVSRCVPIVGLAQPNGTLPADMPLHEMTTADEQRLLALMRGMDRFEVTYPLLKTLAALRPQSLPVQEASIEAALIEAKRLVDRCDWGAATRLLAPLTRAINEGRSVSRPVQATFLNLLGCCACMDQDFERGGRYFASALRLAPHDPRVSQNLALASEWHGQLDQADAEWNRFLDLLDRRLPAPPHLPDYAAQLGFECLSHLADSYSKKERWTVALSYLQRAQKVRPQDTDILERLLNIYIHHVKRPDDARRTLYRLRQLRPSDPQLELYELDLHEARTLDDLDKMLSDIGRILKKYPNDLRVEERAFSMVGNVLPLMSRLCNQLTDQMGRIEDQVQHWPHDQINWSAVREVMRDLEDEFLKLRQITRLCLPLVNTEEHRRIIRDLSRHIDGKIEECRRLGRW
jgi:tetratricopeptide (TPR) repeat protein